MWKTRLRYLKTLLKHKYGVFRGGLIVGGIPLWRLIIHDWSKFGRWEFDRYAMNFHGDYSKSAVDREEISEEFAIAWLNHENRNRHHVGSWIPRTGQFAGKPLRMPNTYVREMVADMLGASYAYTGSWNMLDWMNGGQFHRIRELMHYDSLAYLDRVLEEIGYVSVLEGTGDPKMFKSVWKRKDNVS